MELISSDGRGFVFFQFGDRFQFTCRIEKLNGYRTGNTLEVSSAQEKYFCPINQNAR
jgi:hypothetical protein